MQEKYEEFCKAVDRLKEALDSAPTELNRDAAIQRFEFTYELAWKVLKKYLARKGIECLNPRDCFKGAYQQKLFPLESEDTWFSMIDDRNMTSHIYNEDMAKKIFGKIKDEYYASFVALRGELEERI